MEGRELPVGWDQSTLAELIDRIDAGKNLRCIETPPLNEETGIVKVSAVSWGRFREEESKTVPPGVVLDPDTRIRQGDLLFSRANTIELVGACVMVESLSKDLCLSDKILRLVPSEEAVKPWIYRYLSSPQVRKHLSEKSSGNQLSMRNISQRVLMETLVPLAPLNEQRRIAAKLDTTLAAVEACRQRLDGVAATLKRFRQAVLAAASSGELTREWREERGLKVAPTISLGEIIKVSSGRFLPAKAMVACGGIPVYGGNGVNGLHNESNVSQPTLVIGRVGYYCGSIHLTPEKAWVTDNALVVRHDATSTRTKYLYYALQGIDLRANDSSTAQPVISGAKIYPLKLMCPCIEEQDEIIDRIESLFTLADQLEARLTAARKIVDRLTPALLAKAFRGELVPQDPGDEPASMLLERLAAKRRAARQAEAGASKPSRRGRPKAAAIPDQLPLGAAPVPPDFLAGLLRECGALSERALLAVSELDPDRFEQQLFRELERGTAREVQANGQVLLEAVS